MSLLQLRTVQSARRLIHLNATNWAKKGDKKKGGIRARGKVVAEPEPVTDAHLLQTRCCGANKMQGGEDPILKPKEEYPDWLWTLHRGKPKNFDELDPNTKDYWYALRAAREEQQKAATTGKKGYFTGFDPCEMNFYSRLSK